LNIDLQNGFEAKGPACSPQYCGEYDATLQIRSTDFRQRNLRRCKTPYVIIDTYFGDRTPGMWPPGVVFEGRMKSGFLASHKAECD
jgi:hypothetical protein